MSLLPFYRCIGIRAAGHKTRFVEKRGLLVLWLVVQTSFNFAATRTTAAATEPYGLDAMAEFERLPYLKLDTMAAGQSSFDRSGGNADAGNFLYVDGTNKVLLDLQGPGTVYRMWFTGFDPAVDYIQVYFDGETTPRINLLLNDLFSGTNAPFLSPLVGNEAVSSGGYFCYLPLPFKKSIRIVSNGTSTAFYYNIGYHVYSPDTSVTTWTGAEDSSAVRNLWHNAGLDPKSDAGNTVVSNTIDLAAGAVQTLLDVAGPRSISAIKLRIPGIGPSLPQTVTDNGRADTNFSQFKMSLNASNSGAVLVRRLDYGIANQKANVFVDGALVGQWFDAGGDGSYRWRDDSFSIPASFTAGKNSITVKVAFVSSSLDWNEFYYWIDSTVGGTNVLTDSLNVGNSASESAHSYVISSQTWSGTQTFQYPPAAPSTNTSDLLTNLWLAVSFDNETNPSVYAPIGSFFAMGQFAPYATRGLPVGMDAGNNLYVYFPMPFASRAVVQLISQRSAVTTNIYFEIRHKPFTDSFTNVGYLKTQFRSETPTTNGADILMLDAVGTGHLVGVVESMMGPTDRSYLEGDERIYVDDNESPAIYGTGTEDFYNGGWYFDHGLFTQPTHGNTAHVADTNFDRTAAYRLFMQDAVPFRRHIRVGIEHGTGNSVSENVWTLAYYYYQPVARAVLTDQLDVDKTASETAHAYSINTQTWNGSRTYSYDGNFDNVNLTDDGRAHRGFSQFTMSLQPTNAGAILRRRFDQGVANQTANVYADGTLVGVWYQGGYEDIHNWRDQDFMIPAAFTSGKSSTRIKVQFLSSSNDWSEFTYSLYSVLPRNQTLQANAQTVSSYVNHDLPITLSGWDPDGNPLSYYVINLPAAGTLYQYAEGLRGNVINVSNVLVSDAGGRVIFAPGTNGTGNPYAVLNFTANNGFSGSVPAQVTVNINLPQAPQFTNGSWMTGTNGGGSFALNFGGSSNATYSVWSSTNLTQWQFMGTSAELGPGQYEFLDTTATDWPARFYRISAP
ncbi:MAG TPA: DUF2961 domain-containing protein [Verrucomicrobiae bacterium]|nr:DUF2961 domain-containing protein [Verrucomicrobiae bacterium]